MALSAPRLAPLLLLALLAGCGGGDSSWNPFRWFGGGERRGPTTLEPKGGFAVSDPRQPMPRITAARWEPMADGRLLVVSALAPTKGWWDAALVTETPAPDGRYRADADGVLRLVLVGSPPVPGSVEAATPADPRVDTLNVALALSPAQLAQIAAVEIRGAGNGVTLRR